MFEWCSCAPSSTTSPADRFARPQLAATRFTASVTPRTKMHSASSGALRNRATSARAPS